MTAYTYKGFVRLSDGQWQEVTVQADNSFNATAMLEAQYGKGSVVGGAPILVPTSNPKAASRFGPQESVGVVPARSSFRDTVFGLLILCLLAGIYFLLVWIGMPWKWALGLILALIVGLSIMSSN